MTPLEKLRKARERNVTVDGHTYTIRRPTNADIASFEGTGLDLAKRYVVGWDLKEMDVLPGGTDLPLAFDSALWAEWLEDQPQIWSELVQAIKGSFLEHEQKQEAARKN